MNDAWFPNGEPDPDYPIRDDDWYAQQDNEYLAKKDREDENRQDAS